jgi:hypothetical protein
VRRIDLDDVCAGLRHQQRGIRPLEDLAETKDDDARERQVGAVAHKFDIIVSGENDPIQGAGCNTCDRGALWVRCSRKGEIFVIYPRPDRDWDAHASYRLDGTLHQKSYGHIGISVKRQPLTEAFRGSEHLGLYSGHGPKSTGAVCDPKAFDGVVIVEPGILGPRDGSVGVDLVEPGYEPEWNGIWANAFTSVASIREKSFREMVVHRW